MSGSNLVESLMIADEDAAPSPSGRSSISRRQWAIIALALACQVGLAVYLVAM